VDVRRVKQASGDGLGSEDSFGHGKRRVGVWVLVVVRIDASAPERGYARQKSV